MNSEEFIAESIEFVKKQYSQFQIYQNVIVEIFGVFDKICKDHQIDYAAAYGTLIGECRDGGMIPWDPDVDVCVATDQIPKLITALQECLPNEYYFRSNLTEDDFPYFEIKIGKKGYNPDLIHLDVFYVIGVPDDVDAVKFAQKASKLYNLRDLRASAARPISYEETKAGYYARKLLYRMKSHFVSMKTLNRRFNKLCAAADYRTAKSLCILCELGIAYDRDSIEPMQRIETNGREIGMPNKPIEVLDHTYKNYKEYLPIENRFNEFYQWLNIYNRSKGNFQNINYYK